MTWVYALIVSAFVIGIIISKVLQKKEVIDGEKETGLEDQSVRFSFHFRSGKHKAERETSGGTPYRKPGCL